MSSEAPCFESKLSGLTVEEAVSKYGENLHGNDFLCPTEGCQFLKVYIQNGTLVDIGSCALTGKIKAKPKSGKKAADETEFANKSQQAPSPDLTVVNDESATHVSNLKRKAVAEKLAAQEPTSLVSDSIGMKGTRSLWTPHSPFRAQQR